jgi:hypothetical protein
LLSDLRENETRLKDNEDRVSEIRKGVVADLNDRIPKCKAGAADLLTQFLKDIRKPME